MNPFVVIIPSCEELNMNACLDSIQENDPGTRVFVYANGDLARKGTQNTDLPCAVIYDSDGGAARRFIYSRAINESVARISEDQDLILLNDDTRLLTPNGFDLLREAAYAHPECGLMFPSVTGCTGNPEQITQPGGGVRLAKRHTVPFIAVYIRREIWNHIGPMDEQFRLDYGCEDNDYCYRVKQAGFDLGVFDGCVIEHGVLPSTYRAGGNRSFAKNAELFRLKHGVSLWDLP